MVKKWKHLFATQFLGVFNDNLLKSLICFVSVIWLTEENRALIVSVASALLVLPFILFSALAGKLAVIKSKKKIVKTAKLMEIPIMLIAFSGFFFQEISLVLLALFFMGLQSAIYSPSKYGLIRDIGGAEGLSYGAGTMEMLAFTGVLTGTVIAGFISDVQEFRLSVIGVSLLFTAVLGWLSSKGIKAEEPEFDLNFKGSINPIKFLRDNYKWAGSIKGLNTTILGLGTFWFVGALLQMNLIIHCPETLGLSNTQTSFVIAFVAVGIGLGCFVSGLMAKNKVELGIVPIGGFGLSVCMTVIAFFDLGKGLFITMLFFGSFFSGLYKVPLSAWIQERVEGRKLGDILAYNNLIVFIFILISSVIFILIEGNFGTNAVFIIIALVSWMITAVTLIKIPAMMVRFILYILSHSFFNIKLEGENNIPKKSGALLVANHLSLIDSLLVIAAVPRMVRFVVHQHVYDHPMLNWWFKRLNIIPILPKGGPGALEEFNRICQEEINKGHVVCIFPEGQISRTGHIHEFKKGIEHIAKGIKAPIIPMHFDNVIGSPFSYYTGSSNFFKIGKSTLKRRVSIKVGHPLPTKTSAFEVRQKIIELSADIFADRISDNNTLAYFFIQKAKKNGNQLFTFDKNYKPKTYRQTLKEILFIADKLKITLSDKNTIALSIEDSYKKVIYNISLNLLGKIVINLDDANEITMKQLEQTADTIISDNNKAGKFNSSINTIEVSEPDPGFELKRYLSTKQIVKSYNSSAGREQIATIIYDTNEDKEVNAIQLSNKNILCNILGLKQVHQLSENDSILAQIPLSTSFGYTTNLWLPACLGLKVYFNLSTEFPDIQPTTIIGWEEQIDKVIHKHLSYHALKNIKHVISGHFPLPPEKEEWIRKNWNTEIRYGFGIPECSPIISINCPDYEIKDLTGKINFNEGNEKGSVGRSLPGVAIKIIDEKNNIELGENETGKILVKGPNVMNENLSNTNKEFMDGWLATHFIGSLDSKGFLTLKNPLHYIT